MKRVDLHRAAQTAVEDVMGVQPGEQVLVVTDTLMPSSIPQALLAAAGAAGAEATAIVMSTRQAVEPQPEGKEQPTQEPLPAVAAAMERSDVIFSLAQPVLNNTDAELAALDAGARVLRMLLWDFYEDRTRTSLVGAAEVEASFIRANSVDIPAMGELTRRACRMMATSRSARMFSEAGTDLRIELDDQSHLLDTFEHCRGGANPIQCLDGQAREPSTWDESAGGITAAVCADAEGVVVIDHSIWPIGLVHEPIVLHVADRRVVRIEGGAEARRLETYLASFDDPNVYHCPAEWGIGTHGYCIDSGNFLEHEKMLGNFHAALGDDIRFGGTNYAPVHLDAVFVRGSLELDGQLVARGGEFMFPPEDAA